MIKYKSERVKRRAELLHEKAIQIIIEMFYYCEQFQMPFLVTETVTTKDEDDALGRVSPSHREARAWDLRTIHWPEWFLQQFVEYFTLRHGNLGAISSTDQKRKFIVDKSKTKAPHLHCQLDRTFAKVIRINP